MWRVLVILTCLAAPAVAGPWPRGTGQQYLSFSATVDAGTPGISLYHEWGLSDRLTLISSASYSQGGQPRAMISASHLLFSTEHWRASVAAGAGVHDGEIAARGAISVGRGIQYFGFPGWLTAEFQAIATPTRIEGRAEGTLGFNTPGGMKIYSQVAVTGNIHRPAPVIIDLRPVPFPGPPTVITITRYPPEVRSSIAAAIPVGRKSWLDIGVSKGFQDGGTTRISFGLWKEF